MMPYVEIFAVRTQDLFHPIYFPITI